VFEMAAFCRWRKSTRRWVSTLVSGVWIFHASLGAPKPVPLPLAVLDDDEEPLLLDAAAAKLSTVIGSKRASTSRQEANCPLFLGRVTAMVKSTTPAVRSADCGTRYHLRCFDGCQGASAKKVRHRVCVEDGRTKQTFHT
jgi:hypothetical protein